MGLRALALTLLIASRAFAEPWDTCLDSPLPDATATTKWTTDRTANAWDPNWVQAFPARSETATVTTDSGTPKAKYLLANKRWLVLFEANGRLRGITDRHYGEEFIRDDADAGGWDPFQALIYVGDQDTDQYGAISSWAPIQTPDSVTFPVVEGGQGIEFTWSNNGTLFAKQRWWLSLDSQRPGIYTKLDVYGTASGIWTGYGIVSAYIILQGLLHDGAQDLLFPYSSGGALLLNWNDTTDDAVIGGIAPYPGYYQWARFVGVLNNARHGLYVGIEDETSHVRPQATNASTTQSFKIQGFPVDSGGVGNSVTVGPVRLLPICSEALPVAVAKEYRKWALSQPELVGYPVAQRTDRLHDIQLIDSANPDTNAWSTIRSAAQESCAGSCTAGTVDDLEVEELVGVKIGYWAANWDTPVFDNGNPLKTAKSGVAAVNAEFALDYPDSLLLSYVTPIAVDLSALYDTGTRCNGGTASVIASSLHANAGLLAAASQKAQMTGVCSEGANESNCQHIVIGPVSGACLAELNPNEQATIDGGNVWYASAVANGFSAIYWDVMGLHQCDHSQDRSFPNGCNPNLFSGWQSFFRSRTAFNMTETREHSGDYLNTQIPAWINWSEPYLYESRLLTYPLHALVYHDRILGGGARIRQADGASAMQLKAALALVWGGFIGPITGSDLYGRADFTNGTSDGVAETTLKSASSARTALSAWLVDGEMLSPIDHNTGRGNSDTSAVTNWVEVSGSPDTATIEWIQGAWWRARDGRIALIYRNADAGSSRTAYVKMLAPFGNWASQDCLSTETKGACGASSSVNNRSDLVLVAGAGITRIMYFDPR